VTVSDSLIKIEGEKKITATFCIRDQQSLSQGNHGPEGWSNQLNRKQFCPYLDLSSNSEDATRSFLLVGKPAPTEKGTIVVLQRRGGVRCWSMRSTGKNSVSKLQWS
jgi:hypothetical protein